MLVEFSPIFVPPIIYFKLPKQNVYIIWNIFGKASLLQRLFRVYFQCDHQKLIHNPFSSLTTSEICCYRLYIFLFMLFLLCLKKYDFIFLVFHLDILTPVKENVG